MKSSEKLFEEKTKKFFESGLFSEIYRDSYIVIINAYDQYYLVCPLKGMSKTVEAAGFLTESQNIINYIRDPMRIYKMISRGTSDLKKRLVIFDEYIHSQMIKDREKHRGTVSKYIDKELEEEIKRDMNERGNRKDGAEEEFIWKDGTEKYIHNQLKYAGCVTFCAYASVICAIYFFLCLFFSSHFENMPLLYEIVSITAFVAGPLGVLFGGISVYCSRKGNMAIDGKACIGIAVGLISILALSIPLLEEAGLLNY